VLRAVRDLDHATPEAIGARLQSESGEPPVNASTVYRSLTLLEQLGLVKHAHLAHGVATYHVAEVPAHVHAVCRRCEGITDLPAAAAEELASYLEGEHGFVMDVPHLSVTGLCRACATETGIRSLPDDVDPLGGQQT
jgi:Fur family ferric uptake transcriptional regulator